MKISAIKYLFVICLAGCVFASLGGCGVEGYSNEWLYPDDVASVRVEMFDSNSFRRGHEVVLTDAICKRIEAQTPYKIITDMDTADTVLSGRVSGISNPVLSVDRNSGTPIEQQATVTVSVTWKNLKTGEVLINDENVVASASYSTKLGQDFEYGSQAALNKAAERVVELMEKKW